MEDCIRIKLGLLLMASYLFATIEGTPIISGSVDDVMREVNEGYVISAWLSFDSKICCTWLLGVIPTKQYKNDKECQKNCIELNNDVSDKIKGGDCLDFTSSDASRCFCLFKKNDSEFEQILFSKSASRMNQLLAIEIQKLVKDKNELQNKEVALLEIQNGRQTEIDQLRGCNRKLQAELKGITSARSSTEDEAAELKVRTDELLAKQLALDEEIRKAREELTANTSAHVEEIDNCNEREKALINEKEELQEKFDQLEKEKTDLLGQIETLQKNLDLATKKKGNRLSAIVKRVITEPIRKPKPNVEQPQS